MSELEMARLNKLELGLQVIEERLVSVIGALEPVVPLLAEAIDALEDIGPPGEGSTRWNDALDKLKKIQGIIGS